MQLSLYVRRGPTSGQVFPLSDRQLTLIGRNSSNHLVLADRAVSANHCVIRPRRSKAGFVLMDARSRHGTRVNDRPVGKALIGLGDAISIGPFELDVIETPAGEYALPPKRPAASRPARFEIAPRGWRKEGSPLPPGSATVLGRGPVCHVNVDDTFASSCHCILCLDPTDDGRMPFAIDLHSSNGTFVSRRPIHKKHLLPGDRLVVGDHEFRLRRIEGVEVAPPEPEVEIPAAPPRVRPAAVVAPAAAPAEPEPREAPEPVVFAPEPEPEPEPLEPILPAPPPEPEPAPPAPEEPTPSLADVLTPIEVGEAAPVEDALTEADFEPVEALDEERAAEPPAPTVEIVPEPVAQAPEEPVAAAPPQDAKPLRRDTETKLLPRADEEIVIAAEDTQAVEPIPLIEPSVPAAAPPRLLAGGADDYDAFFGFERPPFRLVPDPDCFYDAQPHWDALDTLVRWLKTGPPVAVLFGEMGCGKSLLVECIARRLSYRRPLPVVVRSPLDDASPAALAASALARAAELYADLPAAGGDPLAVWHGTMRQLYLRKGLVAFLLDDADTLPQDDLRRMAELLDSEDARGVVRVLLTGDESLRDVVAEPPLAYHLGTSCYLMALESDEVPAYLAHRVFHASGSRELPFTRRAVELIAEHSGGLPALIHVVADAALLLAFREGQRTVGRDTVERAVVEALEPAAGPQTS